MKPAKCCYMNNMDRVSDCFPSCLSTNFHSDLVSECLAVGPAELVVVTLRNAVLVCLYFVVCTLLGRIPQIQWWHQCRWPQRGHGGPRCPIGREPERLDQHMAPRVSTFPAVIPERLCCLSICRSLQQICFFLLSPPHSFHCHLTPLFMSNTVTFLFIHF